jgi:transcription initiation factor TFIID subunit 3
MKKHSKSEDDSKWTGTLLGKPHEQGEVVIEGGPASSIDEWHAQLLRAAEKPAEEASSTNAKAADVTVNTPGSSVLSSIGDADMEEGSL